MSNQHKDFQVAAELNAVGLSCPMPLLKAKQKLNKLEKNQVLRVLASDPGSKKDFASWCELSSNQLLHSLSEEGNQLFVYYVMKGE